MPWLTVLSYLLRYGPEAVGIARELWPMIHHDAVPAGDRPDLLRRLENALSYRRATASEMPLDRLRDDLNLRTARGLK